MKWPIPLFFLWPKSIYSDFFQPLFSIISNILEPFSGFCVEKGITIDYGRISLCAYFAEWNRRRKE